MFPFIICSVKLVGIRLHDVFAAELRSWAPFHFFFVASGWGLLIKLYVRFLMALLLVASVLICALDCRGFVISVVLIGRSLGFPPCCSRYLSPLSPLQLCAAYLLWMLAPSVFFLFCLLIVYIFSWVGAPHPGSFFQVLFQPNMTIMVADAGVVIDWCYYRACGCSNCYSRDSNCFGVSVASFSFRIC